MLHLAGDDGMDMADMKRSWPKHYHNVMWNKLLKFEDAGIVKARVEGLIVKYLLDPGFAHYAALDRLLAAIVRGFPNVNAAGIYAGRKRLWTERRSLIEENRRRRSLKGR